jgi:hypothetical protein
MGQIFAKVIQARRASSVKEEDVLQQFCDARYQVGGLAGCARGRCSGCGRVCVGAA